MSTKPTYNYRQPPPADYVDPEPHRATDEILVYQDNPTGYIVMRLRHARAEWKPGWWWSPIPPTPPKPRRYEVRSHVYNPTGRASQSMSNVLYRVIDTTIAEAPLMYVADWIYDEATAQFIADALEGREAS